MPVGRPFSATNPGNPKGRPPAAIDIAALARQHGPRCIQVLAEMLEDPDRKVRGFAAQALLDRGFGKPKQPVEAEGAPSIGLLHLIACKEVQAEIERALAAGNGTAPPVIDGEPASEENTTEPQQHEPIDILAPAKE
jgi:hypothetical protein